MGAEGEETTGGGGEESCREGREGGGEAGGEGAGAGAVFRCDGGLSCIRTLSTMLLMVPMTQSATRSCTTSSIMASTAGASGWGVDTATAGRVAK